MGVTTIQINNGTLNMLRKIKDRTSASSYDETIIKLIKGQTIDSMAGALARKKNYSHEEITKCLRDKFDRD